MEAQVLDVPLRAIGGLTQFGNGGAVGQSSEVAPDMSQFRADLVLVL
jgi:hypothetical protein